MNTQASLENTLKKMRNEEEIVVNGVRVIRCYDCTAWVIGTRITDSVKEAVQLVAA